MATVYAATKGSRVVRLVDVHRADLARERTHIAEELSVNCSQVPELFRRARPLPPHDEMQIDDLGEEEGLAFLAALEA